MNTKLFTKSEKANENYLSRVVKVDNIRLHTNADRLEIITIDGGNIIVARDSVKTGDVMIYCAVESALNKDFLSKNNQFEDKELNADVNLKGFFNKKGRVRAINLRGEPSRGFLFPLRWIEVWRPDMNIQDIEKWVGTEFDTIDGIQFSKKYIVEIPERKTHGNKTNRRNKRLKQFDKLIENQFNFHYDTQALAKYLYKVNPEDVISITEKLHGTSICVAHILVNRQLNWFEKLLKKTGVKIQATEYGDIVSSRGVIKNRYINKEVGEGFYEVDVWMEASKRIIPVLAKGEEVFAEIVGYLPGTTKFIQKNHDYRCNEGDFEIYVYRVTCTNPDGIVYELSAAQVQQWCKSKGLKAVRELYYGKAKDLYPELDTEQHWHQNFFEKLKNDKEKFFMECYSPNSYNQIPHEGIVIRNDSDNYMPALKLKTDMHYQWDSSQLDKGEIDIETSESVSEIENV